MKNDFDIFKLFITKDITVYLDNGKNFKMKVKTIRDFFSDRDWNGVYSIWTSKPEKYESLLGVPFDSSFEVLNSIIFNSFYKELEKIGNSFKTQLKDIIPDVSFDNKKKTIFIGDTIMTEEIWNYILSILKLSYGDSSKKESDSPDRMSKLYQAQKERESRINAIRGKKDQSNDNEWLMKRFLYIIYAFPSLTIEYLLDQTLAQIQWLYKYAAGSVSYNVNANIFAAGNMKKDTKLEFFIK